MSTTAPFPVSAAILAGGRSSRMGQDKAFLPCAPGGGPLIARQAALLRNLGSDDLLVSGRPGVNYELADARVLHDAVADAGPLAGLATLLAAARHPWLLVIAVDLPHLSTAYLEKLLAAGAGRQGVVPQGPHGYEPLVALYPKTLQPIFQAALASCRLGLQPLLHSAVAAGVLRPLPIAHDEQRCFTNWNTPDDLLQ